MEERLRVEVLRVAGFIGGVDVWWRVAVLLCRESCQGLQRCNNYFEGAITGKGGRLYTPLLPIVDALRADFVCPPHDGDADLVPGASADCLHGEAFTWQASATFAVADGEAVSLRLAELIVHTLKPFEFLVDVVLVGHGRDYEWV